MSSISICHRAMVYVGCRAIERCSFSRVDIRKYHKMRLVQFKKNSLEDEDAVEKKKQRLGVELTPGGDVLNLQASDPSLPNNMHEFLEGGKEAFDKAERALSQGNHIVKRRDIRLLPPITNPEKVLMIGMNYAGHCEEQNVKLPREPIVSGKFANTITGPYDDIIYNDETQEMDWEVELGIVIGKGGKYIKESDAMDHVIGYTVCNDVSAREWQLKRNGRQWVLSKSFDTFCPIGPAIVTKEALSDPHNLGIRCRVNGVIKQDSNTSDIIFKTPRLLAHITRFMTLKPGDIILTGTPSGVGFTRNPPEFLKRGDIVECEIDEIGTLVNKVV